MTAAQWAWLGAAHAAREREHREFTVNLVGKCFEGLRQLLMQLIGSESSLPKGLPKGQFVTLIGALASDERLQAFREIRQGGNLTPEQEHDFFTDLKNRAASNDGRLPPELSNMDITGAASLDAVAASATAASATDATSTPPAAAAGSFDSADFTALFAPYLTPDK